MAVRNNGGCRRQQQSQRSAGRPAEEGAQPVMRRWPHPVTDAGTPEALDAALSELCCALGRQTRLLAEIRTLLESLTDTAGETGDKAGGEET